MLRSVDFLFPAHTPDSAQAAQALWKLFSFCPAAQLDTGCVELVPGFAANAFPTTKVTCGGVSEPMLRFSGTSLPDCTLKHEGLTAREQIGAALVEISEINNALEGRILWIDHTGLNAPTSYFGTSWEEFINLLGDDSLLYSYPTGEPWFFVLPGTIEEQERGPIEYFPERAPRFELVALPQDACLCIQFDIQTDFKPDELARLFPSPKGVLIPGLENYFRSVFIKHPWFGLEIRIDIRFGPGLREGEWETGQWLAQNGRRCNNVLRQNTP